MAHKRLYYQIRLLDKSLIKGAVRFGRYYKGKENGEKLIIGSDNGKTYLTRAWATAIAKSLLSHREIKHYTPVGVSVMEYDRQLPMYEREVTRLLFND